jgi:hypothetical protein
MINVAAIHANGCTRSTQLREGTAHDAMLVLEQWIAQGLSRRHESPVLCAVIVVPEHANPYRYIVHSDGRLEAM